VRADLLRLLAGVRAERTMILIQIIPEADFMRISIANGERHNFDPDHQGRTEAFQQIN